jgi:hypothetical protein
MGSSLRRRRGNLDLGGTVIAGNRSERGIVYGYGFPSRPGRIKIGMSTRGVARIVEQSTGFPEKPTVHFLIHHRNPKDLEESLHLAMKDRQADTLGVEWFDATLEDVIARSPDLRQALGRQAAWRRRKLLGSVLLAAAGLILAPVIYPMATIATVEGVMSGRSIVMAKLAAENITSLRAEALWWPMELLRGAAAGEADIGAMLIALIPSAMLAAAPWRLGRRQAR